MRPSLIINGAVNPRAYLILIAFFIPFGEFQQKYYLVKACIVMLVLLTLFEKLKKHEKIAIPWLSIPLAVFTFSLAISFLMSKRQEELSIIFATILGYSIMIICIYNIIDRIEDVQYVLAAAMLSMVLVSVFGLIQFATGKTFLAVTGYDELYMSGNSMVLLGTAKNPNAFASHYLFVIPISCSIFLLSRGVLVKILLGACILLFGVVLLFTVSRGAILAVGASGIFICLLFIARGKLSVASFILAIAAVAGAVEISSIMFPDHDLKLLLSLDNENIIEDKTTATEIRKEVYAANVSLFTDNPVFGVGYDNSRDLISKYGSNHDITPHNNIIGISSEQGLFGLIPFLIVIAMTLWVSLKAIFQTRSFLHFGMIAGMLGAFIAFHINGLAHKNIVTASMWLLNGMLLASGRIEGMKWKRIGANSMEYGKV